MNAVFTNNNTVHKINEISRKFIDIKNSCFVPINKVITITLV